ncbi:MAG: dephospho-CoA kinase [Lentisphaeria bacterium]|nr:dephospho-CoA kinase [Lentisphaeria bacterium]
MISAVTGTIGCGKSTVFGFFRQRGWATFDADGFCRSLYEENDPELAALLRERCVGRCFAADGVTIDRRRVGTAAFADSELLAALTSVIYPRLDAALDEAIARARECGGDLAAEIPLLYEKGYAPRFDRVIAVWCDDGIRRRRLREFRGMSDEEILRRESCQWPAERKLEAADFAVVNHGTVRQLEEQFERLLVKLRADASRA